MKPQYVLNPECNNDHKSVSDYGNPLITPCFFQNNSPISCLQDSKSSSQGYNCDIFNEELESRSHGDFTLDEMNSQDLKEGLDCFAYEQQLRD